jgi:hypothetical protein
MVCTSILVPVIGLNPKKGENSERYGILSIDVQIKRISDNKLVIVSHRNLYRMKNELSFLITEHQETKILVFPHQTTDIRIILKKFDL